MNSSSSKSNFPARSSCIVKSDATGEIFSSGIHNSPSLAECVEDKIDNLSFGPVSTKRTKRAKRLCPKKRNVESDSSNCKRIRCDDLSNYIVIGSDISFSDVIEDVYPEVSTSFAIDHQSLEQSQIFSFEESYELSQCILGNDEERSSLEDEYSISSWTTGGEELTPSEDIANPSLASSLVEYHPSFFNEYSPIPNDSKDAFDFSRQVSDDDESSQEISLAHTAMSTAMSTPSLFRPLSPISSSSSIESSCSESSSPQQKEQNNVYEDITGFLDDFFSGDEGYSNIADVRPDICSSDEDRHTCTANDVKPDTCSSDEDRHTCTANDLKSEACSSFDKGHANIDANLRSDTCSSKDKEITKIDKNEETSTSASKNEPVNEISPSSNASGAIVLSNLDVLLGKGRKATTPPGNKRFRKRVAKRKHRYFHSARSVKSRIANQVIKARHTCTANDLKSEACSSFDKGHANIDANLRSDTCSSKDKEITKIDKNEETSTSASKNEPVNEISPSSNASGAIVLSNLDVLLGRGKKATIHPGNKRFREIVAKRKHRYSHSDRPEKSRIANQVIEAVHNYGGRFLQYCKESSSYIEVDDRVARKKSSQRLRESNE